MSLEDQLAHVIIKQYLDKGLPLSKVLDNPLFNKLPLEKRVELLEQYSPKSPAPRFSKSDLLEHIGIGSILGLGTTLGIAAASGHTLTPRALGIAAGFGGIMGSVVPGIALAKNYKRDVKSNKDLQENKYLEAIAGRSMSNYMNVPAVKYDKILQEAENRGYQTIVDTDH